MRQRLRRNRDRHGECRCDEGRGPKQTEHHGNILLGTAAIRKPLRGNIQMSSETPGFSVQHHDWHSPAYVEEWIARDITRDEERRPLLARMLSATPFQPDASIRVLDVGGGYGLVTEEVLKHFPRAQITLQDYSVPMLDRAQQRFSAYAQQVEYVRCDLSDPAWTDRVQGPFDLAVSALALHNLRDMTLIATCYRGICELLRPDGVFVDCDRLDRIGGVEAHLRALRAAGFSKAECLGEEPHGALLAAYKAR